METRKHVTIEGKTKFIKLVTTDGMGVIQYSVDDETNISIISCLSVENNNRHRKIGTHLLLEALSQIDLLGREARVYLPSDNCELEKFFFRGGFYNDETYHGDGIRMKRNRKMSFKKFICFIRNLGGDLTRLSEYEVVNKIYEDTYKCNIREILDSPHNLGNFLPLRDFIYKSINDDDTRCSMFIYPHTKETIKVRVRVGNNPCLVIVLPKKDYEKPITDYIRDNKNQIHKWIC